jgi:drug/metabolite transporter (DMT)-like permease
VTGRLAALVLAVLAAFAGNSLLCRAALGEGATDPATFTFVRLASGALVLLGIARARGGERRAGGSWAGALGLFAYAALFSWAYVRIPAGVGALVLFAFVQLTMLGGAVRAGAGPTRVQGVGIVLALAGLAVLVLPGAAAPDALGVVLMAGSGVAWGAYSLLGRRAGSPLEATARSFVGAVPLGLAMLAAGAATEGLRTDLRGLALAVASGALASGLGYVLWYAVLARLDATRAAAVQLAVPVLAALGGIAFLGEPPTVRLAVAAAAIVGGIGLAIGKRRGVS